MNLVWMLAALAAAADRLDTLEIPVPEPFPEVASDVLAVAVAMDPSFAGNAGLFDQPASVPSFGPRAVKKLTRRLDADLEAMRALPWRDWPVDAQIDFRMVYALAETLRHGLQVERLYERRPAHRAASAAAAADGVG